MDTEEGDYDHFGPPFILSTTEVLGRIRNLRQKLFPTNQLLPVEIQKYDTRSILEGMHNCIAHQDYERRNPWLVHAMAEVNMIDTLGYGIHEMTKSQRSRYLPLPDYRCSTSAHVVLEVLGRPIDAKYSQLLLQRHDLDIDTVILLDRVQKGLPITDAAASRLRREGLVEGRKGSLRVSAHIAAATETEVGHSHSMGVESVQMKEMLKSHLKKFPGAPRPDIDKLLRPLLPSSLNDTQRRDKVTNLLSAMKNRDRSVRSSGRGPGAKWYLAGDGA